jgi:hypothetical protein
MNFVAIDSPIVSEFTGTLAVSHSFELNYQPEDSPAMNKDASGDLREKARNWKCLNFAITEHGGDTAALLRKAADAIVELGDIEILDITYRRPPDPPDLELTVTVYFYFRSEP